MASSGAGIALIVLGIILGIVAFPFGFAVALIGIGLLVAHLVGRGKRAADSEP